MKASHQWLRAIVPGLPEDPKELAARFTAAGLEVEAMHDFGVGSEKCVVARVVAVRPHPSKSGLRLVTIDRGQGQQQEVVCGAPNVPDAGGLVVLAPLGTHLPAKGMTIERRAIGGVTSEGMLCSEQELGLSEEGDGIIALAPGAAEPGTIFAALEPAARDTVFEIGLTPNRPDGLGHVGLAREAAALFGLPFAMPRGKPHATSELRTQDLVRVRIDDAERCPHYAAAALTGVGVGESPAWMRYRLAALGVRAISTAVDVTNFVMLEYGHPLHAFDLDKVRGGEIVVRRAKDGEKLATLDGVERTLSADDLVIADAGGPTGLAGVMGGGESEISASTKRVLLECAYFEPRGVRRAARRHGMHTEASHRFERGVDHGDTAHAIARAAALLCELTGATAAEGTLMVVAKEIPKKTARLRHARLEQLLGVRVPRDEAHAILERLGLALLPARDGDEASREYELPTHRPDLAREEDLIEEVARVRGYDLVPAVLPAIRPTREEAAREEIARRARKAGAELGLAEAITYGFVSKRELEVLGAPAPAVVLQNPLNELATVMRTSLLPGLLRALSNARRHGVRDVRLFTVGPLFLASSGGAGPDAALPNERMAFAAIVAGDRAAHLARAQGVDVWDGKGLAEGLVTRLVRRRAEVRALPGDARPAHLHPRAAAAILVDGRDVGRVGLLHPDVADALDVDGHGAVVVEIDLESIDALGAVTPKYEPIPRFPASTRDVALVVHDDVPAGDVESAVREAAGALAVEVSLFDRFVGGAIPQSHSSLAFHVVYRATDRTLTDDEVDRQHAKVVAEVGKRFGATLRA